MEDKDAEWIKDSMDDNVNEEEGDFKGSCWWSTDGKMSVSVESNTPEGRKAGLKWGKTVYDRLKTTYGTKQAHAVKEYKEAEGGVSCEACGEPAIERKGIGKTGKPYHGIFCTSENKSHTRWI
uniref:Uncharacterized protein n=1 Tax=viral metagenome TaxID=1070528 RepID=A0A6M3JGC9_9ZZZZ